MKLHRFFIEEKITHQDAITLSAPGVVHQFTRVLRFQEGQKVVLLDNTGTEFYGTISVINEKTITVVKDDVKVHEKKNKPEILLCPSLIKKDKFDWVVQKCTEIGISGIQPVISDRTEKTGFKIDRAIKIVTEASEQSERVTVPQILEPQKLRDVVTQMCEIDNTYCFALHMKGESVKDIIIKDIFIKDTNLKDKKIALFIGPEGGWTDGELEFFTANNVKHVSVGDPVLRAETASIVASTLFILS